MSKMRAMVIPRPGERFRMEERDIPEPGHHEVRIRVRACGVCHSDSITVEGHMPGLSYPRIPGHEVIGSVDLDPVESAPLLCAGITTFTALRNCGARAGDLVAIHGVGGLGHLGIQFSARCACTASSVTTRST